MTNAMTKLGGMPRMKPLAIHFSGAPPATELASVFWPEVMTLANPRPASIMISVVMNGCSPRMETNAPLMQPTPRPMSSARKIASHTLTPEASICMATAITEPTERSMPAVEITNVMPVAIMR